MLFVLKRAIFVGPSALQKLCDALHTIALIRLWVALHVEHAAESASALKARTS